MPRSIPPGPYPIVLQPRPGDVSSSGADSAALGPAGRPILLLSNEYPRSLWSLPSHHLPCSALPPPLAAQPVIVSKLAFFYHATNPEYKTIQIFYLTVRYPVTEIYSAVDRAAASASGRWWRWSGGRSRRTLGVHEAGAGYSE